MDHTIKTICLTVLLSMYVCLSYADSSKEPLLIGYSAPSTSFHFWDTMRNTAFDSASPDAVVFDYSAADLSWENQLQALKSSLEQPLDGYLIGPTSDKLAAFIDVLKQQNLPVVTVDVPIENNWARPQIATDSFAAAATAAQYLHQQVVQRQETPGHIIIVSGDKQQQNARSRVAGMISKLKPLGYSFDVFYARDWLPQEALKAALEAFENNRDYQAAFSTYAGASVALAEAAKFYQLEDLIHVGFDQTPATLTLIENGQLAAVVAQDPQTMAKLGVKYLIDRIEGREVPLSINVPTILITKQSLLLDSR